MNHTALGKKGEAQALEFLKKKGYKEVAMNWRIDPYEVDLIMIDHDYLVFVEVKTRSTDAFGNPLDAVNPRKRQKLIRAAHLFIVLHNYSLEPRFDVISIVEQENASTKIFHFEEAFYPIAK
jgi:putative endonuclease